MRTHRHLFVPVVALLGVVAAFVPDSSTLAAPAAARARAATATQQHPALAIWPETDRSVVPATLPAWRTSAPATVRHFAHAVLGYTSPVLGPGEHVTGGKPGEEGFYVSSSPSAHRILIEVRRVVDATHWSVISMWGFGRSNPTATVGINSHEGYVRFGYWGASKSARLIVKYGDNGTRLVSTTNAVWSFKIDYPVTVSGAVMVLFVDASGQVFTGWGIATHSGNFAAG